tara:strand:- start:1484 stop:2011 length:528 start_codon:yes stop_codon:yes gene_type:complete
MSTVQENTTKQNLDNKLKKLIDKKNENKNIIENHFDNNYSEEDEKKIQENFKNMFPDYDEKKDNKLSSSERKYIYQHIHYIFNEYIIDLYNYIKKDSDPWYINVKNFIEYHDDMNIESPDEESEESEEIIKNNFHYFVGEKCANIDEDEFDGPNDLDPSEWELLDDILIHYFNIL